MIRMVLLLVLIILAILALYAVLLFTSRSKHRAWVPGSKPLASPGKNKRWAYDTVKEEWHIEDKP